MTALLAAEWIKMRSLRSTVWTVALTVALSVGLAYLAGASLRSGFDDMPAEMRASFDPLFATFSSLTVGQLALVVLAAFVVTGEYSTGTIGTSLTAVPRRGRFFAGKALAGVAPGDRCCHIGERRPCATDHPVRAPAVE